MRRNKEKILVFLMGLVFAIFILEIALQAYGIFYRLKRDYYKNAPISKKNDKYVIFCLGNSFTAGAGAAKGESYPEHLQRLFNENSIENNVAVVNKGVAGMNSADILDDLEENIFRTSPGIIILQTGSPNIRNLHNYGLYLKRKNPTPENKNIIFKSRIFRLFIILRHNMSLRPRAERGGSNLKNKIASSVIQGGRSRNGPSLIKKILNLAKVKVKLRSIARSMKYKFQFYRYGFSGFMRKLVFLLEGVENFPYSVYNPEEVKKEDIYAWLESDVIEIIRLAGSKGIKVWLLSYPLPLESKQSQDNKGDFLGNIKTVNEIKHKVAEEEKVPFVDCADLFFFFPEDVAGDSRHPNAKGYEIIAQRIYKRLSEIK